MHEMQYLGDNACPTVSSHETTACMPVCISPFAEPGQVVVECTGAPVITNGYNTCGGTANGCCEFTISQSMRIDIPVSFGANVQIGETYVSCGLTTGTIDQNCGCGGESSVFSSEDEF